MFEVNNKFLNRMAFRLYLIFTVSDLSVFRAIRLKVLSYMLRKELKGVVIDGSVRINGIENLSIGDNVSIHHYSEIVAIGGLKIGNDVSIGRNCTILTSEHSFSDKRKPIKYQPILYKPVEIRANSWIGANVTILAGVELPEGIVVAAGAVVTKSFMDKNIVIAGVPAKIIKHY